MADRATLRAPRNRAERSARFSFALFFRGKFPLRALAMAPARGHAGASSAAAPAACLAGRRRAVCARSPGGRGREKARQHGPIAIPSDRYMFIRRTSRGGSPPARPRRGDGRFARRGAGARDDGKEKR